MKSTYFFVFLFLTPFLFSCRKGKSLKNFDTESFKTDKLGCNGSREKLFPKFDLIKKELKGFSEPEIVENLGKPDMNILSRRGQKSFVYFLEKGKQCESIDSTSTAKMVVMRFNAVELVNEVTYEIGKVK